MLLPVLEVDPGEDEPNQSSESQFDHGEPVRTTEELDNLRREYVLLVIPEGLDADSSGESVQQLPCDSEEDYWGGHHRLVPEALDEILVIGFQIIVLILCHPRWQDAGDETVLGQLLGCRQARLVHMVSEHCRCADYHRQWP